jgi:AcrR family transcriptional regulator
MTTQTIRGASTRERLVTVARELFASRGYRDASIQGVLEAAGVSRGALYHHFANKEQLFEAVLECVESEIADVVRAAGRDADSPRAALRAGCAAWLRLARDPTVRQIALIDAPTAVGWARWREIDARHGFGMLRASLRSEAQSGRLSPELVDPYAHILLAALMELGLVIAQAETPASAQAQALIAVEDLLERLLPEE